MENTESRRVYGSQSVLPPLDIAFLCKILGTELKVQSEILLMQAFAMMTTALGPAVVQITDSRQEALCLYQMSFLEPSGGKTRSLHRMKIPFDELEPELCREVQAQNREAICKNQIAAQAIKELEKKAAKNMAENKDYSKELEEIAAIQANISEIKPEPVLFINPSSTAALLDAMEFDGAVSWCVAEGESLVNLIKRGGHEAILSAWNMERAQCTRRASPSTDIKEPFLTLYVAMQPEKLLELSGQNKLQKTGFLSRFLFGFHQNVTMTPGTPLSYNEHWAIYIERIRTAFGRRKDNSKNNSKTVLRMTQEAFVAWNEAVTAYAMRQQTDLSRISEWVGKISSQLIRISALLHLFDEDDGLNMPISEKSVSKAKELLDSFFIPQALDLHNFLFPDLAFQAACTIADIIARYNIHEFQQTHFHQRHRNKFKNANHFKDGLNYLEYQNVLIPLESAAASAYRGGRPLGLSWRVDGLYLQPFHRNNVLMRP